MPLLITPSLLAASPSQALPCRAAQLSLGTGGRAGDFNGMSHSGTLLVIRNRGARACTVPGVPPLTFEGAGGKLPITRAVPRFLHPGPVVPPVVIAAGGRVVSVLRWVSGPVFDQSRCYRVRTIAVRIGGGMLRARLAAHICGPASGATVEQPVVGAG